jgi:chorismate--pyruvate lyase
MPKTHKSIHSSAPLHFSDTATWQPFTAVSASPVPPFWRDWLMDPGSLTQRLLDASDGQFQVEVLSQSLQRPSLSERRALFLPEHRLALVREVILMGRGVPWVFARSVIPLQTLTGRLRKLRHLDNSPLGALLFSDPSMSREPLQWACIEPNGQPLAAQLECMDQPVWGRRSVFKLSAKPMLVCEVFLHGFLSNAPSAMSPRVSLGASLGAKPHD